MFNRKTMITLSLVMLFCFIPTAVLPVPMASLTIKVTSPSETKSFDGTAEDLAAHLEQLESQFRSLQGYDASLLRDESKVIKLVVDQQLTLISEPGGRRLRLGGGKPDFRYSVSADAKTLQCWVAEKEVAHVDLSGILDENLRRRGGAFLGYLTAEYVVAKKSKVDLPYDQQRAGRTNSFSIVPSVYATALWPIWVVLAAVAGCEALREYEERECYQMCGGQNNVKKFSYSCLTLTWECECK